MARPIESNPPPATLYETVAGREPAPAVCSRRGAPAVIIALAFFWSSGAVGFFIAALAQTSPSHLLVGAFSLLMYLGILKVWRAAYWCGAIVIAFCAGIGWLQLQIPSWSGSTEPVILARLLICASLLFMHRFAKAQQWFELQDSKRNRVSFWLVMGSSVVLGEFFLPLAKSLGQ